MAKHHGIQVVHSRKCATYRGGKYCSCSPAYKAEVWIARDNRKIRRSFSTLAAARNWRHDAMSALRKGTMAAGGPITIRDAAEVLLKGIRAERSARGRATSTSRARSATWSKR